MDVTESESWLTAGFLTCSVVYFSNAMAGGNSVCKNQEPLKHRR
jgi:hypothetical protein